MAKKYSRSQYKKERNANKDTRPKATLRNARVSTTKAAFVLDAIRGKDVETALGILLYNPRYASTLIEKLLKSAIANAENNTLHEYLTINSFKEVTCFMKEIIYEEQQD